MKRMVMGLAGLVLVLAGPGAQAAEWSAWTQAPYIKAGFGDEGEFLSLWFLCDGPGPVTAYIGTYNGHYPDGSTQTVAITAAGTTTVFSGAVEFSDMDDSYYIPVKLDLAANAGFFDSLMLGASAEIVWPASAETVPLNGSGQALGDFLKACTATYRLG